MLPCADVSNVICSVLCLDSQKCLVLDINKLEKSSKRQPSEILEANQSQELEKKEKAKKNTSLRLDKKTLKALKIIAIEQDTSIQKLIEGLIKDYIKTHGKEV